MTLIVQKFGGTSVANPQRIQIVAERIAHTLKKGHQLIVVVSAMGHTTDQLVEQAYQVCETPSSREMDMLLTAGERISMALLSMALSQIGIQAISLTGSQSGIITDAFHQKAKIKYIRGHRIEQGLSSGKVVIVAGFQGVSELKEVTTLGRGGSDTSAVALAIAFKAQSCEIYTDVDGVYSADPHWVAHPKLYKRIDYHSMIALAHAGAAILHSRSVILAKQYRMPLMVRNSFYESEGTKVMEKNDELEYKRIVAVSGDTSKLFLQIHFLYDAGLQESSLHFMQAGLKMFHVNVLEKSLGCFIEKEFQHEWNNILIQLKRNKLLESFEVRNDIGCLTLIGDRFTEDFLILHKAMEILTQQKIPVKYLHVSSFAACFGVPIDQVRLAVQFLHLEFFEIVDIIQ